MQSRSRGGAATAMRARRTLRKAMLHLPIRVRIQVDWYAGPAAGGATVSEKSAIRAALAWKARELQSKAARASRVWPVSGGTRGDRARQTGSCRAFGPRRGGSAEFPD